MPRPCQSPADQILNPAEAAARLGVSTKALRLYEQRGLVTPHRTATGWRAYGPDAMARAAEIVGLRTLGLSLAQVARVLAGDPQALEPALAGHQASLEAQIRDLGDAIEKTRRLRADLAAGNAPAPAELARLIWSEKPICDGFALPWPWGGEWFELRDIGTINFIVGPLGSGKTRLAQHLAEALPATFLGLDRATAAGADSAARLRIEKALSWLLEDGATASPALTALITGLEADPTKIIVVDYVEQGLDHSTQQALIALLRTRTNARPLFLMTRSTAILDLAAMGPTETLIFCPANHSVPTQVAPYPGAPGYEAVASCLASPEVRARTEGAVVAWSDAKTQQYARTKSSP